MFLVYLVMDHLHWICHDFQHSSGIWSVTGRIINSCCITLFLFFDSALVFWPDYLRFTDSTIIFPDPSVDTQVLRTALAEGMVTNQNVRVAFPTHSECVGYHTLIANLVCGILYHTVAHTLSQEFRRVCGSRKQWDTRNSSVWDNYLIRPKPR